MLPGNILEPSSALGLAGLLKHGRSQINACGMLHDARESADQEPGSAGYVEDRVVRAGFGHLDNTMKGALVSDRWSAGKRHRLARELVKNTAVVSRVHRQHLN